MICLNVPYKLIVLTTANGTITRYLSPVQVLSIINNMLTRITADCLAHHPEETCIPKERYMYNYKYRWPLWVEALFTTFYRPIFGVVVGLVIAQVEFPAIFGRNIINVCVRELLCCRFFAMFSKLTYGIYLNHIFFITLWYASSIPAQLTAFPTIWQCYMERVFNIIYLVFAVIATLTNFMNTPSLAVISEVTILALGLHLTFEMPLGAFSTYIVKKVQGSTTKPKEKDTHIHNELTKTNIEPMNTEASEEKTSTSM